MAPSTPTDIPQVPLEELRNEKMSFGKTHLGKTYEEIWTGYPEWIRWFYQHYRQSNKAAHRRVIMYIEKKVEEMESLEAQPSQTPVMPKSHAAPKVMPLQAKAKAGPAPSTGSHPLVMDEPAIPWPASEDRMMVQGLQQRVLNMENVLQQILQHIAPPQQNTVIPAPATEMPPVSVWDEEEDLWNAWDQ